MIDADELLEVLVSYSFSFTSLYLDRARNLCHMMLKRYASQGRIIVNVPKYRGFHVRPSTLISKIVNHYGSEVCMKMGGETYSAAVTLDLFRANEKLNAQKRRNLASVVAALPIEDLFAPLKKRNGRRGKTAGCRRTINQAVRDIIQILFETKKLVIYQTYSISDLKPLEDEALYDLAIRTLNRLLVLGKIDIEVEIKVVFQGDRRVLADIDLLAANGYGEDNFGNNLALPRELNYLRK